MTASPGRSPDDDDRSDDDRSDDTRPLGWGRTGSSSGWNAPDARPQSWDSPASAGWDQPTDPPPTSPYPQAPYPQAPGGWVPYGAPVADHPRANLALVLGIVGLVGGLTCGVGFLLSPVAWGIGGSAVREIRASGGHFGGEGQARAGQVLGIVGTVLLVLAIIAVVAFVLLAVGLASSTPGDYGNV